MRCPPMRKFPFNSFGSAGLIVATSNDGCASAAIGDMGTIDCCAAPFVFCWAIVFRAAGNAKATARRIALFRSTKATLVVIGLSLYSDPIVPLLISVVPGLRITSATLNLQNNEAIGNLGVQ